MRPGGVQEPRGGRLVTLCAIGDGAIAMANCARVVERCGKKFRGAGRSRADFARAFARGQIVSVRDYSNAESNRSAKSAKKPMKLRTK
jgi:hypothetical protein